jgi:signal transduction histidine kinase
MLPPSELLQPKLLSLCESTIHQIRTVLAARHVSIQCYRFSSGDATRTASWQPLTDFLADNVPTNISGELSDAVGQQLRNFAAVHFKITTKVGSVTIAGDCHLTPIFCDFTPSPPANPQLWGRICVISNPKSVQNRDTAWLMSIAKLLGQALSTWYALPHQTEVGLMAIDPEPLSKNTTCVSNAIPDKYSISEDPYCQIAELIAQDRLKDEFISKISHDLRAPLMNMRMALKMFKISTSKDPVALAVLADERHRNYFQILESECEREIGLINNVLDLQKLETGNVSLELQSIDLVDWLPTVVETFQGRAKEQNLQIDLRLPNLPAHLLTDEVSLQRIVTELLHNACKYTAEHQLIYCELEYPVGNAKHQPIYLLVGNQAEIKAADLPHIFDRFYRVPTADRRKQGGTGLGLSLVRSLVEQLHGQITVQSMNGWTTFTVALPISPPEEI